MKHNFVPLRLQIENSSNATIQIVCKLTGKRMQWNEAAKARWVADSKGIPFDSYYSPEAVEQLKREENSSLDKLHADNLDLYEGGKFLNNFNTFLR